MGKCLSCCEPDEEPMHNGHPICSTVHKPSPPSPIFTAAASAHRCEVIPAPLICSGDMDLAKTPSGSDKIKMFSTSYPKLPPIHKASYEQSKHTFAFPSQKFTESGIVDLFEKYRDSEEDVILADGIEEFCKDLQVRPDDFKVLVLAWKFNAETMCCFTREEFTNGCRKLYVDSIEGIREKFPEILIEVSSKQKFRDLYKWTYNFGLDTDVAQRTLPVDMAISLWGLVFSQNEPAILKRWLNFLEMHPRIKGIPKDTWDMFITFCDVVGGDLTCYDDTEAWPSLLDDFVEYENDRENQNIRFE